MKGWSNKEFDGTMFIGVMLLCFLLSIIFTYINPEFAKLTTTQKVFEIIEKLFFIIVGYLFRKASESNGNGSENKETPKV